MYTKLFNKNDVYYLFNENGNHTQFVVNDSGIYLTQSGLWETCVEFISEKNDSFDLIPFYMIKNLCDNGQMWKKGSEKMAQSLRKKYESTTIS